MGQRWTFKNSQLTSCSFSRIAPMDFFVRLVVLQVPFNIYWPQSYIRGWFLFFHSRWCCTAIVFNVYDNFKIQKFSPGLMSVVRFHTCLGPQQCDSIYFVKKIYISNIIIIISTNITNGHLSAVAARALIIISSKQQGPHSGRCLSPNNFYENKRDLGP